jgi:hypothetical protein
LKELDGKRQKLVEAIVAVETISPQKALELRGMLSDLDREREETARKLAAFQSVSLDQQVSYDRKDQRERITELRAQLKFVQIERDQLKEQTLQQEYLLEQMKIEKREYDQKLADTIDDVNNAHEHRKKMEKSYLDNISLLNNKIAELNEYIEELENKNNQRVRESFMPGGDVKSKLFFLNILEKFCIQRRFERQVKCCSSRTRSNI